MTPIRPNKKVLVVFVVAFAAIASVVPRFTESPDESPVERAYRECRPCGIDDAEFDGLIDDMRHSTLNHEEDMQLFLKTFADPADAAACLPCVEAILDAGGLKE